MDRKLEKVESRNKNLEKWKEWGRELEAQKNEYFDLSAPFLDTEGVDGGGGGENASCDVKDFPPSRKSCRSRSQCSIGAYPGEEKNSVTSTPLVSSPGSAKIK